MPLKSSDILNVVRKFDNTTAPEPEGDGIAGFNHVGSTNAKETPKKKQLPQPPDDAQPFWLDAPKILGLVHTTVKADPAIDCSHLVCKEDTADQQIVMGEVYAPNRPDAQGEFMRADEIEKMAHQFLADGKVGQIDVLHNNKLVKGCRVVESYIAPPNCKDFLPGSWVVAVYIPDKDLWADIKAGKINGFSMEALVSRHEQDVEFEIPPVVTGRTSVTDGHDHPFYVSYDKDGKFLGGITGQANGHSHKILAGTHTETTEKHSHRFSSVDSISME